MPKFRRAVLCVLLFGALCARADSFTFPATGVSAREGVLLAIDDLSLPLRRNVRCVLEAPSVRAEPVMTPSRDDSNAPDYLAAHFYGTVLFDHDKFRMWYYACHTGKNPDWPEALMAQAEHWKEEIIPGPLCYAESADGIHWVKPKLGQLLFKGSRENNALDLPSALTGDACVIRDDTDPDPARRYKLAYWSQWDPFPYPTMRLATSPDGLHWQAFPEPPIKSFLEHASMYQFNGAYFANSQTLQSPEQGKSSARVGTGWMSVDFDHWLAESAQSFALPWVENPERDEVHLGVGARGYPNVLVGLYCIWHNRTDFGKISGDLGLLVSNDGLAFREPVKGRVWLRAADSAVTPVPGKELPTVLCQANGILNVADETRIYHGRWRNSDYGKPGIAPEDYWGEIALATLPRDRWGALTLTEGSEDGSVWTTPVHLPKEGCDIFLNGEGLQDVAVEVADERFVLQDDHAGAHAGRAALASGLDARVQWPAGDLSAFGDKTVRFRLNFKKWAEAPARVYAIYLRPARKTLPTIAAASVTEFMVMVGDHAVNARVLSPPAEKLTQDPALLVTFAGDREMSTSTVPYCLPTEAFLVQGHRVLSLDLPCHGERITEYGGAIAGFRNMVVAGMDPFALLVDDAKAAITACIERGLARPGRIAVGGTSRGGYMALRVMAADPRIAVGAGFAPVTDWTLLREFEQDKEHPAVKALALDAFAAALADRPIYVAIGSTDERVGTARCQAFANAVSALNTAPGLLQFKLTEDKGHSLGDVNYAEGRDFLLSHLR